MTVDNDAEEARFAEALHWVGDSLGPSPDLYAAVAAIRPRRRRRSVMVICALLVAAAASVGALGVRPSEPRALSARSLHIGGQPVALPRSYRLVSATTTTCQAWLEQAAGDPVVVGWPLPIDEIQVPALEATPLSHAVVRGRSGDAGCVESALTPPYDAPPGVTATSPLFTAQQIGRRLPVTPTVIDGDQSAVVPATIRASRPTGSTPASDGASVAVPAVSGSAVFSRIPDGAARFRLLVVIGWAIPPSILVQIAKNALTATSGAGK